MSTLDIVALRELNPAIVALGSSKGIIQSMLDFDYLAGRQRPSVVAIVAAGRKTERYFFGNEEVAVPVYNSVEKLPERLKTRINLFVNLSSGRRVLASSRQALGALPGLVGGVVFAEGLPERHALALAEEAEAAGVWLAGGASVGVVVPGVVKLGAIGGVQAPQLVKSKLFTPGNVAVVSSSGGMVSEIIRMVATSGHSLSFSLALGGERFPMTGPQEVFAAAEADPATEAIVYFGELGGLDEYELAEMIARGEVTKPVVAYIAGSVAELFETPPQFGHAKAMAASSDESARAKAAALEAAGARSAATFAEFAQLVAELPGATDAADLGDAMARLTGRRPGLIASSVSHDDGDGEVRVMDQGLLELANNNSFAKIVISMFLGREAQSAELVAFVDYVLKLLVDHGPYVSGAVNTIVTARAGRDLVSSLAAGLLTIGPRFGGAVNQAAATWLEGVSSEVSPAALVETYAARRSYISGIGHRKYRSDFPDPRVSRLLEFAASLEEARFTTFARGVEAETTRKKGNLILNVDGAMAAVLLDLLAEKEGYAIDELQTLVATEFFNSLFVLSRSVGFMAHYFDQVRLDEGIFRLGPGHVTHVRPVSYDAESDDSGVL
ncbi:MAG TPA: citrate/2-methylcitrate synthase [Candidatus Saccharimonadia bacterium]|nr:citrate/2-methylcitrate synthase [Candidatus Saccharimonadia bacterium]